MNIVRSSLVLLAMSGRLFAQDLSKSAFEERRRDLRERYLESSSIEEKRAVIDQFRALQLSQGTGIDSATTAGALQEKMDPRVAELMKRIAWTDYELSSRMTPEWPRLAGSDAPAPMGEESLAEYSKENVEEYAEYRAELRDRLVSETGAYRRLIAGWLEGHHEHQAYEEKDSLADLRNRLADKIVSFEKISKAMGDAQLMKDQVDQILKLKDVAEAVQKIGEGWADPTSIPGAVVEALSDKIKDVATFDADDAIVEGVGGIGEHLVDVVAAMEGYGSLADLMDAMRRNLDQIEGKQSLIAWHAREAARARRIAEAPYFFEPGE